MEALSITTMKKLYLRRTQTKYQSKNSPPDTSLLTDLSISYVTHWSYNIQAKYGFNVERVPYILHGKCSIKQNLCWQQTLSINFMALFM